MKTISRQAKSLWWQSFCLEGLYKWQLISEMIETVAESSLLDRAT
jgi:hypothetical protein